jgi:hypothetical protein
MLTLTGEMNSFLKRLANLFICLTKLGVKYRISNFFLEQALRIVSKLASLNKCVSLSSCKLARIPTTVPKLWERGRGKSTLDLLCKFKDSL